MPSGCLYRSLMVLVSGMLLAGCSAPPRYACNPPSGPILAGPPQPVIVPSPTPIATPTPPSNIGSNPDPSGVNGGISLTPTQRATSFYQPVMPYGVMPSYGVMPVAWNRLPGGPNGMFVQPVSQTIVVSPMSRQPIRPHRSTLGPGSRAAQTAQQRGRAATRTALAPGLAPTPAEDAKYRGGKTIKDLHYINVYIGGADQWSGSDRQNIDSALESAMTDAYLNHVVMQYFGGQPITAQFHGAFLLNGYRPQKVIQSDVKQVMNILHAKGAFASLPISSTIVNFFLPPGAILADPDSAQAEYQHAGHPEIPFEDEADSREGLGGYHGSIHVGSDVLYYSVCVYSERRSNGFRNGIPVFSDSWKNVVATAYHELQEARTDPDVDDAVAYGDEQRLGWTSDRGEEIGDYPLDEAQQISLVIKEVPLANGSGTVPVQLIYSNAVHGPEGPIPTPHSGQPLPITPKKPAPSPAPSPSPQPAPASHDLKWLNTEWSDLPDSVKLQIIKFVEDNLPR